MFDALAVVVKRLRAVAAVHGAVELRVGLDQLGRHGERVVKVGQRRVGEFLARVQHRLRGYFADVPAGEDFVGLTRAFLFAGTPSVLASLWEVNDQSTAELMQGFYRRLAQTDKATALAMAQREMRRRGGRFAHPIFWAPFVLVGAMK